MIAMKYISNRCRVAQVVTDSMAQIFCWLPSINLPLLYLDQQIISVKYETRQAI